MLSPNSLPGTLGVRRTKRRIIMADDEINRPMRETELFIFEMFEMMLDILVRLGVPQAEFEGQFERTLEHLKPYPQATKLAQGMREILRTRVAELERHLRPRIKLPTGTTMQ
jgi:hypothetical protein